MVNEARGQAARKLFEMLVVWGISPPFDELVVMARQFGIEGEVLPLLDEVEQEFRGLADAMRHRNVPEVVVMVRRRWEAREAAGGS